MQHYQASWLCLHGITRQSSHDKTGGHADSAGWLPSGEHAQLWQLRSDLSWSDPGYPSRASMLATYLRPVRALMFTARQLSPLPSSVESPVDRPAVTTCITDSFHQAKHVGDVSECNACVQQRDAQATNHPGHRCRPVMGTVVWHCEQIRTRATSAHGPLRRASDTYNTSSFNRSGGVACSASFKRGAPTFSFHFHSSVATASNLSDLTPRQTPRSHASLCQTLLASLLSTWFIMRRWFVFTLCCAQSALSHPRALCDHQP